MTVHAKYPVSGPGIAQVFDLSLAVPTAEACCAKGLVSGQDGQVLNLITASTTAVGAVVANKRPISKQKEVCIRVKERVACVTTKAVEMPSVSSCDIVGQ